MAKGAIATLFIRAISISAQLGFFVMIARAASLEVVGFFAVASAFWVLARALLPMGWNIAVLRSVSVLRTEGNFLQASPIVRAALAETALLGVGLGASVVTTALLFARDYVLGATLACVVALLWAEIGVLVAYLRAMGDLIWSQLCDSVIIYVIPVVLCGAFVVAGFTIDFVVIATSFLAGAVLSFALLFFIVVLRRRRSPREGHHDPAVVLRQRSLARRLWWNQAFSALSGRMSVLLAAPVAGVATTAIVETGLRTQLVGATLAWAGGTVASPRYAIAHDRGSPDGPKILNLVTWAAVLPSLFVVGVLAIWGDPILGLLGEPYRDERWAITLMAFAAVIELPAASGGYFLMMTGRERVANFSTILQLSSLVLLIFLCGPLFGATGIACAVLCSSAVRSVIVLVSLRQDDILSPLSGSGLLTMGSHIVSFSRKG